MVKRKAERDSIALPEPTLWARAVLVGTAVLGVAMNDRSLNMSNLDLFGRKVRDAVQPVAPVASALVQALETRVKFVGGNFDCDRLRTARSASALCEAVTTASALDIVDKLANARLETSSSAVQSSLVAAAESLHTLHDATVVSTLQQLVRTERSDLSASKYLREARMILHQDEIRRSLPLELRMVVGAAEAYLSTGKQSIVGSSAFESAQDYDFATPSSSSAIANVVAPVDVVIESKKGSVPPPSQPRRRKDDAKKNPLAATLVSADLPIFTRVNVERNATGLDRTAARAMLDDAYREALQKIDAANAPMLVNVVVALEVGRGK